MISVRKGSLSSMLAVILGLLVMISLVSTIVYVYRESIEGIKVATYHSKKDILEFMKTVSLSMSKDSNSIIIQPVKGPVQILAIMNVTKANNGNTILNKIKGGLMLTKTLILPYKVSTRDKINSYILVLLGNGNYVLFNPNSFTSNSSNYEVNVQSLSKSTGYYEVIAGILKLKPYILGGTVTNYDAFMEDPVPGSESDTAANYVPELYVASGSSARVKGLEAVFNRNNYTYTIYVGRNYKGFFVAVPILINRSKAVSGDILFTIEASPINNFPIRGESIFHVVVSYRGIECAVLPLDFHRSPVIVSASNVLYSGELRYSVSRALYYSANQAVTHDLTSFYNPTGFNSGYDSVQVMNNALIIHYNSFKIFSELPNTIKQVVLIVGLQVGIKYYWEGLTESPVNPYARINIGAYALREASIDVSKELVNTPVLVPVTLPNVSVRVTDPKGNVVNMFRVSNVRCVYDGEEPYIVLAFVPKTPGTYKLRYVPAERQKYSLNYLNMNISNFKISIKERHNVMKVWSTKLTQQHYLSLTITGSSVSASLHVAERFEDEFLGESSCWGPSCSKVYTTYGNVPPEANVSIEIDDDTGVCPATKVINVTASSGYDEDVLVQEYGKCKDKGRAWSEYDRASRELTIYSKYVNTWGWVNFNSDVKITFDLAFDLGVTRQGLIALINGGGNSRTIYALLFLGQASLLYPLLTAYKG